MAEIVQFDPEQHVRLFDFAASIGRSTASIGRTMSRLNVPVLKTGAHTNSVRFITKEDAATATKELSQGRLVKPSEDTPRQPGIYAVLSVSYEGVLRVKVGKSRDVSQRLAAYRTLIPELRVLGVWPTEYIDHAEWLCLRAAGQVAKRASDELFEGDIDLVVSAVDSAMRLVGIQRI